MTQLVEGLLTKKGLSGGFSDVDTELLPVLVVVLGNGIADVMVDLDAIDQ